MRYLHLPQALLPVFSGLQNRDAISWTHRAFGSCEELLVSLWRRRIHAAMNESLRHEQQEVEVKQAEASTRGLSGHQIEQFVTTFGALVSLAAIISMVCCALGIAGGDVFLSLWGALAIVLTPLWALIEKALRPLFWVPSK